MMLPQDGLGGCVPMPRKERVASTRIELADHRVISTTMGAAMFGTMWRKMISGVETPEATAGAAQGMHSAESGQPGMSPEESPTR